jgi:HSP20 family protein
MEKEMERFFNWPVLRGDGKNRLTGIWNPDVDVFDEKDQIRIEADLPGLKKDQIEITADAGLLTIKGEKKGEREIKEKDCVRSERYYGAFHRSFNLPVGADTGKVNASYEDGVLKIIIPKKEEAKSKQTKVQIK